MEAVFDAPKNLMDQLTGTRKSLPNQENRMQFVEQIAGEFNHLHERSASLHGSRIAKDFALGCSMKRRPPRIMTIAAIVATIMTYPVRAEKMHEVKVDIGKNIVITAKNSGAPRFTTENHWGLQIYELVDLRPEVAVRYARPGYEILATPLFSLTMYADSENKNDMAVETIQLQYNYKTSTHDEARVFIDRILVQFKQGKWKRYIDVTCPATSGRSAYLDETGKLSGICSLDPGYRPSMEDWLELMRDGREYEWLGDGIKAKLDVKFDEDSRGLTYNIGMEFQDFSIGQRKINAKLARDLMEGDKKGWKSTEDYKKSMAESKIKVRLLEDNAVRRGDLLVPRN